MKKIFSVIFTSLLLTPLLAFGQNVSEPKSFTYLSDDYTFNINQDGTAQVTSMKSKNYWKLQKICRRPIYKSSRDYF